jgi:hypothetical protein
MHHTIFNCIPLSIYINSCYFYSARDATTLLEGVLKHELAYVMALQIPATIDCSMPTEAALVAHLPELSAFLRSGTETEKSFRLGKQRRMEMHRTLEGRGLDKKLSHQSTGQGMQRMLVITKVGFDNPTVSANLTAVQEKCRMYLASFEEAPAIDRKRKADEIA